MKNLILLASLFTISCTTTQGTREMSSVARAQNAANALVAECEVVSEILQIRNRDEKAIWKRLMEKDASGKMKIEKPECINRALTLYESTCQSYEDLREIPACGILFIVAKNERALDRFDSLTAEQKAEIHSNLEQRIRLLTDAEAATDAKKQGILGTAELLAGGVLVAPLLFPPAFRFQELTRLGRIIVGAGIILTTKGIIDISRALRSENKITVNLGDPVLDPRLNNNDRLHLIRSFVNDTEAANQRRQGN